MSNLIPVESIQTMAIAVAKSGLFGVKTPDQAMALMLIAQAEGLHPAIAARDYHIIQGRPALKADAMLARFQQNGGKIEWRKYTDDAVSAIVSHPSGGSVEIEWTYKMAERAGLTKNSTWRQYPRQMLRARVISEGIRTVFPGVAVGVYTPEEVADFDAKPQMQDVTPDDEPSAEFQEIVGLIAGAESVEHLARIRDDIRKLNPKERAIAIGMGIRKKAALELESTDLVEEVEVSNDPA